MAIKLETEEYCSTCRNFDANTIKRTDSPDIRVECKHRQQCRILYRHILVKTHQTIAKEDSIHEHALEKINNCD